MGRQCQPLTIFSTIYKSHWKISLGGSGLQGICNARPGERALLKQGDLWSGVAPCPPRPAQSRGPFPAEAQETHAPTLCPSGFRPRGLVAEEVMVVKQRWWWEPSWWSSPQHPPTCTCAERGLLGMQVIHKKGHILPVREGLGKQVGGKWEKDTFYVVTSHFESVASCLSYQH